MNKPETEAAIYNWSAQMLMGKYAGKEETEQFMKSVKEHGLLDLVRGEVLSNHALIIKRR